MKLFYIKIDVVTHFYNSYLLTSNPPTLNCSLLAILFTLNNLLAPLNSSIASTLPLNAHNYIYTNFLFQFYLLLNCLLDIIVFTLNYLLAKTIGSSHK